MKTAQSIIKEAGLGRSHWGKIIILAEMRKEFTSRDDKQANSWTTCACGKQDAALMGEFGPHDSQLDELGEDFSIAIFEDDFLEAAQLLVKIEYRSAFLLNEMHSADPID